MSNRNRVIYQSEALYVWPTGTATSEIKQLNRVQSCNYSFTINRQNVNQFGNLAAIDRLILEQPTVNSVSKTQALRNSVFGKSFESLFILFSLYQWY